MTVPAIVALLLVSVVGLVIWIIRWSAARERSHGEKGEREKWLARSAERTAKVDRIMARRIGTAHDRLDRIRGYWSMRRKKDARDAAEVSDDERGGSE